MKKLILLLTLVLLNLVLRAQGVQFEKMSSWQDVLKKAALENKYIFVDCYATWCVPCKQMDKEVFSDIEVGNFYTENFISIKVQFDSTANDDWEIKSWRAMTSKFEKEYKISAFPTYLFFNPAGKLISKFTGALTPPTTFLSRSKALLHPENQYYTLLRQYAAGNRDALLIKKIATEAVLMQDWETVRATHEQFASTLDTPYSKAQLIALYAGIVNSNSKGFGLVLQHINEFNKILDDDGRIQSVIKGHLYREAYDKFIKDSKTPYNWIKVYNYIESKAPEFAGPIILSMKVNIARDNGEWEKYGRLKMDYYDAYASTFDHNQLFLMNNELMDMFRNCKDKKTLMRAANWSKYTLENVLGNDNAAAIDTYANLLYKAGKKTEAIQQQKRALELISRNKNADISAYASNLKKMILGVPTWTADTPHSKPN